LRIVEYVTEQKIGFTLDSHDICAVADGVLLPTGGVW
jgi:hypothetical protein